MIGKLEPQAFEYPLCDPVLKRENIAALGIDPVAPEYVAGQHVEQLRSDAQLVAAADETRRKHGMHAKLAAGFARIDLLALIFRDDRARPDDERRNLCELGDDRVGQSEFVEIAIRVAAQIFEGQYRDAFLFRPGRGQA